VEKFIPVVVTPPPTPSETKEEEKPKDKPKEEDKPKEKEPVDFGKIELSSIHCQFQADKGLVCPMIVKSSQYTIKPYIEQPVHIQMDVVKALQSEWGSMYSDEYIKKTWTEGDVLYVMTDDIQNSNQTLVEFMGCVAVDRQRFIPFISHLYIIPKFRNRGLGDRLLQLGENYAHSFGFTEVKLWCAPKLKAFYIKRGWKAEDETKNTEGEVVWIMSKNKKGPLD